ncbi:MAG: DUF3343 domain-containing protein [Treponema sp.]|jgi:hypothetical protein|nr:DUF3343 domain-containing protein [Treponema sp.]
MTFLLTFPDVSSSLGCEKAFKRTGIPCAIGAVPPKLGLSCGYAVRCEAPDDTALHRILNENGIRYSKMIVENE